MAILLTILGPLQLAVLIGLVELVISESLHIASVRYLSSVRRYRISKHKNYVLKLSWFNGLSSVFIAQFIILGLCVWLEFSISSAQFPSSKLIQDECFKTSRPTMAISKTGATRTAFPDVRVGTYVSEANCDGGLYNLTLTGETALIRGYPNCRRDWKNRNVSEVLSLQGSNEAYVANSKSGDPHLAYGLASENGSIIAEDHGDANSNELATRSFWSLLIESGDGSYSGWDFESNEARVISNFAIPKGLLERAPWKRNFTNNQIGRIACVQDDLECYHRYATIAKNLTVISDSLVENKTTIFVRSHENYPSTICIFLDTRVEVNISWVYMEQSIPNAERNRSGQAMTQVSISGDNGQCLDDITQTTSRLYIDALKSSGFGSLLRMEAKINPKYNNLEKTISTLQKAAVITGMNTPNSEEESTECLIRAPHNGSSIGKIETIVSVVYLISVFIVIIFKFIIIVKHQIECPGSIDPLEIGELLEQILLWQKGISLKRKVLVSETKTEGEEVYVSSWKNKSYSIDTFKTDHGYQIWVQKNE